MDISAKDSCSKGFRKWPEVWQPEIHKHVRADDGDGKVAADLDLENDVMTT